MPAKNRRVRKSPANNQASAERSPTQGLIVQSNKPMPPAIKHIMTEIVKELLEANEDTGKQMIRGINAVECGFKITLPNLGGQNRVQVDRSLPYHHRLMAKVLQSLDALTLLDKERARRMAKLLNDADLGLTYDVPTSDVPIDSLERMSVSNSPAEHLRLMRHMGKGV